MYRAKTASNSMNWLLLLFMVLVSFMARQYVGRHIVDDAYVTFRYSRNLAAGQGITYNPPRRLQGSTTPLFTVLLAAGAVGGIAPETASGSISMLADATTIIAIAWLTTLAGHAMAGVMAGWFLAIWPAFVIYSVSGMETSLFVALISLSLLTLGFSRPWLLGILCGLTVLARPDGLLFIGPILFWSWKKDRGAGQKAALAILFCVLPWVLFSYFYFGSVIPHSVIAKSALHPSRFLSLQNFLNYFSHGKYAALSALALWGGFLLWRSGNASLRAGVVGWGVYSAVFLANGAFTDFPWYFVPLLPLYFVGISVAAEGTLKRWIPSERGRKVGAGVLLASAVGLSFTILPNTKMFLDVLTQRREAAYVKVALEIAHEGTDGVVAVSEVGTVGYFYPGPVLDLVGLVSPEAVGKSQLAVLQENKPPWLVSFNTHLEKGVVYSPWFQENYRRVHRIPLYSERSLDVFFAENFQKSPRPR